MSLDIYLTIEVDTGNKPYVVRLFDENITHNLAPMWSEAGVYDALYNSKGKKASEIIDVLHQGLIDMENYPDKYKKMNPDNGWGDYDQALIFLRFLCESCKDYPNSIVNVWK
jgi:hypothetical protein